MFKYTTFFLNYDDYSLFNVIVDTDETATKLLEIMNKEKSGRVTFIPLNRVKPRTVEYPNSTDEIPITSFNTMRDTNMHLNKYLPTPLYVPTWKSPPVMQNHTVLSQSLSTVAVLTAVVR